ncbi:unnamed protein product [Closterium sp. Yama58-4]|nr:unnamed protein product [Closterium sp. Yama58-4]
MDITDEIRAISNTTHRRNCQTPVSESNVDVDVDVHLLPCCIEHNGPAAVSRFFRPFDAKDVTMADGTVPLEAAFRGRRLLGRRLALPDGYTGDVEI